MDHLLLLTIVHRHAGQDQPRRIGPRIVTQRIEIGAGDEGRRQAGQLGRPERKGMGRIVRRFVDIAVIGDIRGGKAERLGHLHIGTGNEIAPSPG